MQQKIIINSLMMLVFLNLTLVRTQKFEIPKILWTFWEDKIYDDDHLLKLFHENHKSMLNDWEIRHLNEGNVWHWLIQIPDFNEVLNRRQFQEDSPTKRSNLIRIALIKHFGGVWMDYTMIMTRDLNWLLNLGQQKFIQNIEKQQPEVFLLYSTQHGNLDKFYDSEDGKEHLQHPTLETFFIAAKPKSRLAQEWFDLYVHGKAMTRQKYGENVNYQRDSWLLDTAREEEIVTGDFNSQYFEFAISVQIILQRKQRDLDENWKQNPNSARQYASQAYNIWYMPTGKTSSIFQNVSSADVQGKNAIKMLMQQDARELERKSMYPNYFVKLFHVDVKAFSEYLLNEYNSRTQCPQNYYIMENSIANNFLLKYYPVKFYKNEIIKEKPKIECEKSLTGFKQKLTNYGPARLIQQFKQWKTQEQQLYNMLIIFLPLAFSLVFSMLFCEAKFSFEVSNNIAEHDNQQSQEMQRILT